MIRSCTFVVTLVMAWALGVCASCQATDNPQSRKTLKGLKDVGVIVEYLRPGIEELGLSRVQLQTDTELSLRKAGIKVSSEPTISSGYLYLTVNCMNRPPIELYGCSLGLELDQAILLARDPKVEARATTWSVGEIYTVGREYLSLDVRTAVGDLVNQFINAYLEQNPRQ